jgi:hypothetical protein
MIRIMKTFGMNMFRPSGGNCNKAIRPTYRHSLPPDFYKNIEMMNNRDMEEDKDEIKTRVIKKIPDNFKNTILGMDKETIDSIDYIMVMYRQPISPGMKVTARTRISRLMKDKNCSDEEIDFFMYLLKSKGLYEEEK